jgi:hypothetical protein
MPGWNIFAAQNLLSSGDADGRSRVDRRAPRRSQLADALRASSRDARPRKSARASRAPSMIHGLIDAHERPRRRTRAGLRRALRVRRLPSSEPPSLQYDGRYEVAGLPAGRFVVGVTPQRIRGYGGDSRRLATPAVKRSIPAQPTA